MQKAGLNKYQYKFENEKGKVIVVNEIIGPKLGVTVENSVGGFGENRLERGKLKESYTYQTDQSKGIIGKKTKLGQKILDHEKKNKPFNEITYYKDDELVTYKLLERTNRVND